MNCSLPSSNFSASLGALVNALVTRIPEMELSSAALILAMDWRLRMKASRMRLRRRSATNSSSGAQQNMISVSQMLMVDR